MLNKLLKYKVKLMNKYFIILVNGIKKSLNKILIKSIESKAYNIKRDKWNPS